MKKTILLISAAVLALCSCSKEQAVSVKVSSEENGGVPIAFQATGDFDVTGTKAVTETTSISTLYVTGTSGTAGSAEAQFSTMKNSSVTLSSGKGTSSFYWPKEGALSFYATNWSVTPTVAASGVSCSVTAGTADYVAGFNRNVANATKPVAITMNHIFGRLYDIKFKCADGVSATIKSVSVTPQYSAGTYTFATNTIAGSTAGSAASITATTTSFSGSTAASIGQANVDRLVIPGSVTVSVTYTASRTGYSKDFTKSATVTLPKGQKSVVTGTLTDDATPIGFDITINPWGDAVEVPGTFN